MSDLKTPSLAQQLRHRRWHWIVAALLITTAILIVVATIVLSRAEPIMRKRVVETLSARFHSDVELKEFHVSLMRGLQISGAGLNIYGDTDPNSSSNRNSTDYQCCGISFSHRPHGSVSFSHACRHRLHKRTGIEFAAAGTARADEKPGAAF